MLLLSRESVASIATVQVDSASLMAIEEDHYKYEHESQQCDDNLSEDAVWMHIMLNESDKHSLLVVGNLTSRLFSIGDSWSHQLIALICWVQVSAAELLS